MGRPRKPTDVLRLEGAFRKNPQREREREGEPLVEEPLGDPPDYFQLDQINRWREIEASCPWLRVCDRAGVELASKLWAGEQRGELDSEERRLMVSTLGKLGMMPGERSKIQVPGKKAGKKAKFGEKAG